MNLDLDIQSLLSGAHMGAYLTGDEVQANNTPQSNPSSCSSLTQYDALSSALGQEKEQAMSMLESWKQQVQAIEKNTNFVIMNCSNLLSSHITNVNTTNSGVSPQQFGDQQASGTSMLQNFANLNKLFFEINEIHNWLSQLYSGLKASGNLNASTKSQFISECCMELDNKIREFTIKATTLSKQVSSSFTAPPSNTGGNNSQTNGSNRGFVAPSFPVTSNVNSQQKPLSKPVQQQQQQQQLQQQQQQQQLQQLQLQGNNPQGSVAGPKLKLDANNNLVLSPDMSFVNGIDNFENVTFFHS